KQFAVAGNDGSVLVFAVEAGKSAAVLEGHKGAVNAVAFSQDGTLLVTGGDDGVVRIRNAAKGNDEAVIEKAHAEKVTCVAFGPDGKMIATGAADKTVKVWELKPCPRDGPRPGR